MLTCSIAEWNTASLFYHHVSNMGMWCCISSLNAQQANNKWALWPNVLHSNWEKIPILKWLPNISSHCETLLCFTKGFYFMRPWMIMLPLQCYLWSRLNECSDLDVGGLSCGFLWLLDTILALYINFFFYTVYVYIVWNFCFAFFEGDKCPSELKLACILEQAVRLALSCCCSVFIISSTRLLAAGCIITSIREKITCG